MKVERYESTKVGKREPEAGDSVRRQPRATWEGRGLAYSPVLARACLTARFLGRKGESEGEMSATQTDGDLCACVFGDSHGALGEFPVCAFAWVAELDGVGGEFVHRRAPSFPQRFTIGN